MTALEDHGERGLLQHHFRDEDSVRIGGSAPGVVFSFLVEPLDKGLLKGVAVGDGVGAVGHGMEMRVAAC